MKKYLFLTILIAFVTAGKSYGIVDMPQSKTSEDKTVILDISGEELNEDRSVQDAVIEENRLETGISKYYTFENGLLKLRVNDKLNLDFGLLGSMEWNNTPAQDNYNSNFKFNTVDIILSGQLKDNLDYKLQFLPHRNINERTILGDVWTRYKYNNHSIYIGRMRKPVAYEPTFSPYDLEFANYSQISRDFGDLRDSGFKTQSVYKYVDIATGVYSNMQDRPFSFSRGGYELDSWVLLKPIANYPELGNLKIGGGFATGKKDYSYNIYSAAAIYDYKKLGLRAEYINKGAPEYNLKDTDGYHIDMVYSLTKKLQLALRFDSYNPDRHASTKDRSNEYVVGLNYYLNNRNTMFVLNYAFCDRKYDSHRISLQARYKTW
ncbi:MAG: porin [Candidatus Gastranaerophilales bacterium]|nr:porin [Candidatus Gastranaerophilales bacterium]